MSVLDKFSGVEIKADRRISEQDKLFCQKNQEAYNKSGEGLKRLAKEVSEIEIGRASCRERVWLKV